MRVQNGRHRLDIRAETSEILTQAIDGSRQDIPIDASTLSRYCNGDCANPLEMIVAMIDAMDADRGAMLLAFLEDAFNARHGTDDDTPLEALFEQLDALDCGEDRVRFMAASHQYNGRDLRQWLSLGRQYRPVLDRVMRKAARNLAESRGRKPSRPAAVWRGTEQRAVGS